LFKKNSFAFVLLPLIWLTSSCSQSAVSDVNRVLDARNLAISHRDISAYSMLIADDYQSNGKTKAEMIAQTKALFTQFNELKMNSFGRDVFIADENNARAAQSYRLKVRMDGNWREILRREELSLIRTDSGWKISAGL